MWLFNFLVYCINLEGLSNIESVYLHPRDSFNRNKMGLRCLYFHLTPTPENSGKDGSVIHLSIHEAMKGQLGKTTIHNFQYFYFSV